MYNKLIILFACILFLLKIYENKVVKNNIDGMLNKLILNIYLLRLAHLFMVQIRNYLLLKLIRPKLN